ncbi:hypothetical protein [Xanthocytophaga agilis]|uniref:Uncharacterized protein n=1 Tax=Xanthocytophaga agilis TaxID=3048010 RepID=A0AAE3UG22_9BACT|nr:hypothetical protein [Xanthocytophaga agilis]MDJ1503925.1 hypothetical protein [Xanthocytophaga agilis]
MELEKSAEDSMNSEESEPSQNPKQTTDVISIILEILVIVCEFF